MIMNYGEALMLKEHAIKLVGNLGRPSKMPGKSYGLPATACKNGSKLAEIPGSVCHNCYARKGMYRFKNVQRAQEKRLKSIRSDDWVESMQILIQNEEWFRWHDSGDIQSIEHFLNILKVCELTPDTKHWLPTKEYKLVNDYIRQGGVIPDNLCIRFASPMIDQKPLKLISKSLNTSTVYKDMLINEAEKCTAPQTDNKCKDCRKCWDKSIRNVSYKYH